MPNTAFRPDGQHIQGCVEKSEFDRFKAHCFRAIEHYGLKTWAIEVKQVWLSSNEEDVRARTWMNWPQRAARITWNEGNRKKDDDVCEQTPEEYAEHEVLHIVFHSLIQVCIHERDINSPAVQAEEHALIRLMSPHIYGTE